MVDLQASHLRRFALYFDVGGELWKPKKEWSDMLAYDWDVLFKPGIAAAEAAETPKYKEGGSVPHSLGYKESVPAPALCADSWAGLFH